MSPRRDKTPPYEIMGRTVGRSGGGGAPGAEPELQGEAEVMVEGRGGRWWSGVFPGGLPGVGVPIILRVPRGMAVLAAAGVLGLIVLAYWVGHTRGVSSAEARLAAEAGGTLRLHAAPQVAGDLFGTGGVPREGSAGAGVGGTEDADPRQPGLNYMILARYPPAEARRLSAFLATQGVETVVVPTDNREFVHVIAVDRGFEGPSELRTEAGQVYEHKLRAAGRAWKRHNGGLGDSLETMLLDKYEGG